MRGLALSSLGMLLCGCTSASQPWQQPWPREPQPYAGISAGKGVADVPAGPGATGQPVAAAAEGYPVDLATVLQLAGAHSLDVAFVREKVHEAHAQQMMAWERFFPTVAPGISYRAEIGRVQDTLGNIVEVEKHRTFWGATGTLDWNLGEAIFATLAASRREEGARATLDATSRAVALRAALAYYEIVRAGVIARVSDESAAIEEKLARDLEAAAKGGRTFMGDALRAKVRQEQAHREHERARVAAQQATIRLVSVLRLKPGIELVPVEEAAAALSLVPEGVSEAEWIERALAGRPEIRAARSEVAAAEDEETGALYGPLIPELRSTVVGGSLGKEIGNAHGTVDYELMASWKIGPGGLLDIGRRDQTAARRSGAEIDAARIRQRVTDEVRAAMADMRSQREQMRLAEQELQDAEQGFKLNLERLKAGVGIPLEVIQAEAARAIARQDFQVAIVDHNQAQLRLFIAAGGEVTRVAPAHQ